MLQGGHVPADLAERRPGRPAGGRRSARAGRPAVAVVGRRGGASEDAGILHPRRMRAVRPRSPAPAAGGGSRPAGRPSPGRPSAGSGSPATNSPLYQPAVVDACSDVAAKVVAVCEKRGLRVVSTGWKGTALRLLESEAENFTMRIKIAYGDKIFSLLLPLAGSFQVSNALVAAGLCIATGDSPGAVFAALEKLEGAPGRLELVGRRKGAPVFVDYAHKPDALDKALKALRPLVHGKLIVVFGCGGDRDAGKRPLMGEVAARLADRVIVTDDIPDPRIPRRSARPSF